MGRPPAQSLPHVDEEDDEIVDTSVECISKTNKGSRRKDQVDVNMFKTFDATAATAIGECGASQRAAGLLNEHLYC
jgi:ArsR family metal-binding transcriptional regulator